jgi:hypothetical protein
VGSFFTTIGAEGTIKCSFEAKKSKKDCRICLDSIDYTIKNTIFMVAKLDYFPNFGQFHLEINRVCDFSFV